MSWDNALCTVLTQAIPLKAVVVALCRSLTTSARALRCWGTATWQRWGSSWSTCRTPHNTECSLQVVQTAPMRYCSFCNFDFLAKSFWWQQFSIGYGLPLPLPLGSWSLPVLWQWWWAEWTTPSLANDSGGGQSELHPVWLMTVVVGKVNYTQPG